MKNTIQNSISELYAIDPSLKEHEERLVKIIEEVLRAQPDTKFDQAFAMRLRTELLTSIPMKQSNRVPLFTKFIYGFSGAAIALLLVVVSYNVGITPRFERATSGVIALGPGAFGSLSSQQGAVESMDAKSSVVAPVPAGFGGGAGIAPGEPYGRYETAEGYPEPVSFYRYAYEGALSIPSDKNQVLRRKPGAVNVGGITTALKSIGFSGIDLATFKNLQVRSLELYQSGGQAYSISVNAQDGSVSLYPNWEVWSEQQQPLRSDQLLSDERVIQIADTFAREHKIDLKQYGSPEVDSSWRIYADQAIREGMVPWIPEESTVRYQLMVQGLPVYDEGGNPFGLMIQVSHRHQRVLSVFNLTAGGFESSPYTLAQESDIRSIIERGGIHEWVPEGGQPITRTLGEPSMAYMLHYQYQNGISNQLLVPAYVFPVQTTPSDQPWLRKTVIVPLVKDLIPADGPRIMPFGGAIPTPTEPAPLIR